MTIQEYNSIQRDLNNLIDKLDQEYRCCSKLRWQAENDVPVDLRNPNVIKWCICYNLQSKSLHASGSYILREVFNIYFSTAEKAEECIKVFETDLIWLHTQFYHRLDGKGVDNAEM